MELTEAEIASKQIRVYPGDYKWLMKEAKKRRTIMAQVLYEIIYEHKNPDQL